MSPRPNFVVRLDAGPSLFLSQELESLEAKIYRVELGVLKAMMIFPVKTDVDPTSDTYAYQMLTQVGNAAILRLPSSEIPNVDIYREKFSSPIKTLADKYSFDRDALEKAAARNIPLESEGAEAARRKVAELAQEILLNGDDGTQLPGLLTNPTVPRVTVASGVGGVTWALKTADEIIRDISSLAGGVYEDSKEAYKARKLVLPTQQYNLIADKPRSTNSDMTVMQYVLKNSPYIKSIESLPQLDGAGTGGTDMMIVFDDNPDYGHYVMPLAFQQIPQQEQNLKLEVICREKSAGYVIKKSLAYRFGEGI